MFPNSHLPDSTPNADPRLLARHASIALKLFVAVVAALLLLRAVDAPASGQAAVEAASELLVNGEG